MYDTQGILSQIYNYNKYTRNIESQNRRGTWYEICNRVMPMHIVTYPEMTDDIVKAFSFVLDKKVLPVGGQAVLGRQRAMTTPWLT